MMGEADLSWSAVQHLTLKQFCVLHDSRLISRWDHTAVLSFYLFNLTATFHNANSKHKIKPKKSAIPFHPYREKQPQGLKVNKTNFSVLKALGNSLCKR